MPRSGPLGTYTLPGAQKTQQPNTIIQSAVNNQGYADIEQTFNTPTPLSYGGTGASTAGGAADALSPAYVNVASGATTNIGSATSPNVIITGTNGITAFDNVAAGITRYVRASGAFTLTHSAALLLPANGANITTAANDTFTAKSLGSGDWIVTDYQRASGQPLIAPANLATKVDVRRNRIVNGDMRVSQENGNTLGTVNGYCPADQWFLYFTTTGAGRSIQRIQSRTLAGATDQLEYKCTTAKASLAAGDSELITQPLEGSNVADCAFGTAAAKPFVDRFQVQLPAGTYHMHYANSANNRHCAVPFVVSGGEANTPVVKSVVVPADTGGTWLTADGVIGIVRDLVLAAGSTYTGGTASTWGTSAFYAATSQANILSSTSNVARLADVGLRLDPDATGVYGQYEVGEVDAVYRAERYWEAGSFVYLGAANNGGAVGVSVPFRVAKAKAPTVVTANTSATFFPATASAVSLPTVSNFTISRTANVTGYGGYSDNWTANARLS